jgi:hypothetical protein
MLRGSACEADSKQPLLDVSRRDVLDESSSFVAYCRQAVLTTGVEFSQATPIPSCGAKAPVIAIPSFASQNGILAQES